MTENRSKGSKGGTAMDFALDQITFQGPPIDDPETFDRLPQPLRDLLLQVNGFIQYGGGFHVRGACHEPAWHSLREAWTGELALSRLFPNVQESDIPFAEDCFGDQFLLRGEAVYLLHAEVGDVEEVSAEFWPFLLGVQKDAVEALGLEPLVAYLEDEGELEPGQLLSVRPPFSTLEAEEEGVSLRPTPTAERLRFLSRLAERLSGLPDGAEVEIDFEDDEDGPSAS